MTEETRVLFVEDDVNLLNSVAYILESDGYEVMKAHTGREALALAGDCCPDLVLLDLGLPDMDGFEVAEGLRDCRSLGTRIVVLTGSDLEDDMVRALETCADDYVVKPVRPRVLLARLQAVMRRGTTRGGRDETLSAGGLSVDEFAHTASVDGRALHLTPTEYRLLRFFLRHPGAAATRAEIICAVHGDHCFVTERSVDFLVHGLRRKLGEAAARIETVRGVGFRLRG